MSDEHTNPYTGELGTDIPVSTLREMYIMMLKTRRFEEKVGELVSQGEIICPCHLYIGEEAVAIGVCSALRKDQLDAIPWSLVSMMLL